MKSKRKSYSSGITRRDLLTKGGMATLAFTLVKPEAVRGTAANSRIEVGCIGLGKRGRMIANMVQKHGGYHIAAVADYFPEVVAAAGMSYSVANKRQYSGLTGYQRMIADGVDAVFLETPPYCFPDHVEAAVKANCHVFLAKPVACDVPGTLRVLKMAQKAQAESKVFLVDFQTRTDPYFIEAIKRVHQGLIGSLGMLSCEYNGEGFVDPPLTETIESRLQRLIWVNDIALGGGPLVNAGIHAIDVALWIAGEIPVSALGTSRIARENPHGDAHDTYSLSYEFASGLILNHREEHLKNRSEFLCECFAQGTSGHLECGYAGRVRILGNHGGYRGGDVVNLYPRGARCNIDTFHKSILNGVYDNPTVQPSVDANLATLLGREAAHRRERVTWQQVLEENKRVKPDLSGLRV